MAIFEEPKARRRIRFVGPLIAVFVILLILVGGGIGIYALVKAVDDVNIDTTPNTGSGQVQAGSDRSLYNPVGFSQAVNFIRSKEGTTAQVLEVSFTPGTATLRVRRGATGDEARQYFYQADGTATEVDFPVTGSTPIEEMVFPVGRLSDDEVIQKMMKALQVKNVPRMQFPSDFTSFSLKPDPITRRLQWTIIGRGGIFQADLNGKNIRRPGGQPVRPSTSTPATPSTPSTPQPIGAQEGARIADCIQRANGDVAKIQACVNG